MYKIEELENKIKEMQEELNKLKEKKKPVKRWRTERNANYWYMNSFGGVRVEEDVGDYTDDERYYLGNYFKTREQAEKQLEKIKIHQQLKDLALELNNGEKIDWNDNNQIKYCIRCHKCTLLSNHIVIGKELGQIYCLDENFLDIAKERIGEENLKKLFMEE